MSAAPLSSTVISQAGAKHECACGVRIAWIFSGDFATKIDLCAVVRLYSSLRDDGKITFPMFARYWLPEAAIEGPCPNQAICHKWVADEWLVQTEGATIDFALITETILADYKRINPSEFVYDPRTATRFRGFAPLCRKPAVS